MLEYTFFMLIGWSKDSLFPKKSLKVKLMQMYETKAIWEFSGTRIDLGALEYVRIHLFYAYRVVKRQFISQKIPKSQNNANE
jgi:hypothetical protein